MPDWAVELFAALRARHRVGRGRESICTQHSGPPATTDNFVIVYLFNVYLFEATFSRFLPFLGVRRAFGPIS